MAVPTFHPEDGADSHSHSPRRRSLLNRVSASQGFPMPFMPSLITSQAAPFNNAVYQQPMPMPMLQRNTLPSGSAFPDLFTETAYLEWVNSLGLSQNTDVGESRGVIPTTFPRNPSKQSSTDISMPDYMSSYSGHNMMPESVHMSGTSLDDDGQTGSLKVPTNTPTGGPNESAVSFGTFEFANLLSIRCFSHLNRTFHLQHSESCHFCGASNESHSIPLESATPASNPDSSNPSPCT